MTLLIWQDISFHGRNEFDACELFQPMSSIARRFVWRSNFAQRFSRPVKSEGVCALDAGAEEHICYLLFIFPAPSVRGRCLWLSSGFWVNQYSIFDPQSFTPRFGEDEKELARWLVCTPAGTGDHLIKREACPVASPRVTSRPLWRFINVNPFFFPLMGGKFSSSRVFFVGLFCIALLH
jgi:hypothetical protein